MESGGSGEPVFKVSLFLAEEVEGVRQVPTSLSKDGRLKLEASRAGILPFFE
jgi:hypothetical protein